MGRHGRPPRRRRHPALVAAPALAVITVLALHTPGGSDQAGAAPQAPLPQSSPATSGPTPPAPTPSFTLVDPSTPAGAHSVDALRPLAAAPRTVPKRPPFRVTRDQRKIFDKYGGADMFGKPTASTRCGLPDDGCLGHYSKGTIYTGPDGVFGFTNATGVRGDLIAVAESQVGYQTVLGYYALHNTKYNEWTGSGGAWCSFFQAWVADRAGHPQIIPRHKDYWDYYDRLTAKGTELDGPKVGAYALLTYGTDYHHTALITSVSDDGSEFTIIEGNWAESVNTRTISRWEMAPQKFYDAPGV